MLIHTREVVVFIRNQASSIHEEDSRHVGPKGIQRVPREKEDRTEVEQPPLLSIESISCQRLQGNVNIHENEGSCRKLSGLHATVATWNTFYQCPSKILSTSEDQRVKEKVEYRGSEWR